MSDQISMPGINQTSAKTVSRTKCMHSHAINNTQICILKFQLQIYFAQFWSPWIKLVPDLDKILCHPVEFSEQIGAHDDWCMCTYKSLSNISANTAKPSQFQCRISIVEYTTRHGKTCTYKQFAINLSKSLCTLFIDAMVMEKVAEIPTCNIYK